MKKNLKRFLGIFIAFTMILQSLSTPMVAFAKEITLKETQFSINKGLEVQLDGGGNNTTFKLYKYENGQWKEQDSSLGTKNNNKYAIKDLSELELTKYKVEATYNGQTYEYIKEISAETLYTDKDEGKELQAWLPTYAGVLGKTMPQNVSELQEAYTSFKNQISVDLKSTSVKKSGDDYVVTLTASANVNNKADNTYTWKYRTKSGEWKDIKSSSSNTIDIKSSFFGDDVDLKNLEVGCIVESINGKNTSTGGKQITLNLTEQAMAMEGMKFLKPEYEQFFFYDNVVKDPRSGFAKPGGGHYTLREKIQQFLDKEDYQGALSFYNKYIYDVFNPNSSYKIKDGELNGSEGVMGNYGDKNFSWAKESLSPFHNIDANGENDDSSEKGNISNIKDNGADYSNFFNNTSKKTSVVDKDNRQYKIDIESKGKATKATPLAFVFQIQTSWQMVDLAHANKQKDNKSDKTAVGSSSKNTEMATLYDIKRALIRFSDYLKARGSNDVAVAITNVQHGATHSMFDDDNNKSEITMFTNDMDQLKNALYSWDSFGDCEHVHYSSQKLQNACTAATSLANNWKIESSTGTTTASNVKKVGIIIGGPTENSNGDNGYGATLPSATLESNLDALYGIRNNEGKSLVSSFDGISWLDNSSNQKLFKDFKSGGYYVASSEDEMYNRLVKIYNEQLDSVTTTDANVQDTTIKDTVTNEFEVEKDRVKAYIDNKQVTIDESKLSIVKNDDGTTTVTYNFGKIQNGQTVKLEIGIKAKDDFMGGNDIKTNTETPTISYKDPEGGNHTSTTTDDPKVNVNVKIPESSQKLYTKVGESVDLSDQTKAYFEQLIKTLDNYSQTNGTLKFEYKSETVTIKVNNKSDKDNEFELTYTDDNGNIKTKTITVKDGKIEGSSEVFKDIPLFNNNEYTPDKTGTTSQTVKVTYTPNETTSKDPVTEVTADVDSKVYAFDTGDDVYVFDYGKSSDLADISYENGLFGNDTLNIADNGKDVDTIAKLNGLAT